MAQTTLLPITPQADLQAVQIVHRVALEVREAVAAEVPRQEDFNYNNSNKMDVLDASGLSTS